MAERREQYHDFHEFIITATMQLLAYETLPQLSVTKICQRAGVSRMAFYRHFSSKEQVVQAYFTPIYGDFLTRLSNLTTLDSRILAENLVKFFAEQGSEIQKAVKADYYLLIFQVFTEKLADFYDKTTTWEDYTGVKRQFWNDFMAAGLFFVLGNWAKQGCLIPQKEVIKMVMEFHE